MSDAPAKPTIDFFRDGEVYDRAMGRNSRVAGAAFLDWLTTPDRLSWLDVGCGTGAFSETLLAKCNPLSVSGVDPSVEQIAYANAKPVAREVEFWTGDALDLPFGDNTFDAAVMALVVQYVPDPDSAMAEMTRVVRANGIVAAYVWPGRADGHPYSLLSAGLREIGAPDSSRPGSALRSLDALVSLYKRAGLEDVQSRTLDIVLDYRDFGDYWSAQPRENLAHLDDAAIERLKQIVREKLSTDESGNIRLPARVHAVRGTVPD